MPDVSAYTTPLSYRSTTNVNLPEVKRVATWIEDENKALDNATLHFAGTQPLLAGALQEFRDRRKLVNDKLQMTLCMIYKLDGYTGESTIGRRAQPNHVTCGAPMDDEPGSLGQVSMSQDGPPNTERSDMVETLDSNDEAEDEGV
ncbi:hypothetical protein JB92DRAFT_3126662 [Gautieria morchelliformis]|nr:hypothetical protein JB92DRAFT_3126662 [Gautieria morchelliformis]